MQPNALKILLKNLAPLILALLALILCGIYRLGLAQSPAPPANLPVAQDVIGFLNQSIDWHRQIVVEEQVANDPNDLLFVNDDRQTAKQILRLSFDFARADAQLLASQGTQEGTKTNEASRSPSLMHAVQEADNEVRQTQAELESDKNRLDTAKGTERQRLLAEIDELQSELDLAQTRSKTLHDILQFVSGASGIGSNLSAQIDQLERS